MRTFLNYAFAATMCVFGVQEALAQPVTGCPAGQAMQSSDTSGRKVTCVALPDVTALQQMDATILSAVAAEKAARESADQALNARLDGAGAEASIVGTWSVTGSQSCMNSSRGFNADMTPLITVVPPGQPAIITVVTQVTGTVNGTRSFRADGTGTAVAVNQNIGYPTLLYGLSPTQIGGIGGATSSTSTSEFTWRIEADDTLIVEEDKRLVNPFTAPPSRVGTSLVIEDLPPFVGRISKDRRTITMTHPGMSIERGMFVNSDGQEQSRSDRFCHRDRVLTRLAD
jgi:hypothetical protein